MSIVALVIAPTIANVSKPATTATPVKSEIKVAAVATTPATK
jgi:hypothetical protein